MKNSHKLALAAAFAIVVARPASAATVTGNLSVTATIAKSCAVTTTAVSFGTYDPTVASPNDNAGNVTVSCVKGTPVTSVQLGNGGNFSAKRQMKDAVSSNLLAYDLYTDTGRTTLWINATSPTAFAAAGVTTPNQFPVYGRIAAAQDVVAGTYNDTVVVTVTY